MIFAYLLLLLGLATYSYALIDPNITFFNHPLWSRFLETMLQLGYYQRENSWRIYVVLIIGLFFFYRYFLKKADKISPLKVAAITGCILLFSYPFLSHDFLKYLFDAKILTFYGKNPYQYPPLHFAGDPWLRFLHWTHESYRYGPIFLGLMAIPSYLSFGKFLPSYLMIKAMTVFFYLLMVYAAGKLNRKWAMALAVNPLIIVDGLVNGHNDIIGLSLAVTGLFLILKKKSILGRLPLLFSVGIKYITLPMLAMQEKKENPVNKILLASFLILPVLLLNDSFGRIFHAEMQTWYYISVFVFGYFYEDVILRLDILFAGLLLCYYPFIRLGQWTADRAAMKHNIFLLAILFNGLYLLLYFFRRKIISLYKKNSDASLSVDRAKAYDRNR